jgi:hypothetical protein
VCQIVTQVAAALDAAHEQGLVHRDVKPANMLRDDAAGDDHPDHVYLSDFGLSKHGRSTSQLTSHGEFLGTMDYVSPEQIEGHAVDGRSDQYALACSAFEMLTGAPPFKQDETLAIMWAQVSAAPPTLTSRRPDLPAAADPVMAKALAKAPGDRYATCLEFAAALRHACGLGADTGGPATPQHGQWTPTVTVPAVPPLPSGQAPPPEPVASLPPEAIPPEPAPPEPVASPSPVTVGMPVVAGTPAAPGIPAPPATPPDRRRPGPAAPGYRLPPGRTPQSRRSRVAALVTCVALLGVIGAGYLIFAGRGTTGTRSVAPLAVPKCTTRAASAGLLANVPSHLVKTGGKPFDVVVTANGYAFVSLTSALDVLRTTGPEPSGVRVILLNSALGEALTHDQKYLLVSGNAVVAFSAAKLLSDPAHALLARLAVGSRPLGLVLVNRGAQLIVADSNRDNAPGGGANLAVIDVQRALHRQPALTGFLRTGSTPRQFALEPGGGRLLVVGTGSGQVQAVKIGHLT